MGTEGDRLPGMRQLTFAHEDRRRDQTGDSGNQQAAGEGAKAKPQACDCEKLGIGGPKPCKAAPSLVAQAEKA